MAERCAQASTASLAPAVHADDGRSPPPVGSPQGANMTRDAAIRRATDHYDSGAFLDVLRRRGKHRTVSQEDGQLPELLAYLTDEIIPEIERLGFTAEVVPNTRPEFGPVLIAKRREGDGAPTVLIY